MIYIESVCFFNKKRFV